MKTRRSKTLFCVRYNHEYYMIYAYSGCHADQILIRHLIDTGIPPESIHLNEITFYQIKATFLK